MLCYVVSLVNKMAVNIDTCGKEEFKTQFATREGVYRLITLSEYSRPNRVGYSNMQGSTSVRVSFVTLPDPHGNGDRICFNIGRELYVFIYKGVKKEADLTKPVDKKMYKGTSPTCHDFNTVTMTSDNVSLLVGFSTGQVQVIDPIKKEISKLFNEERLIDKTKVTCIRWVPGSANLFLASHASGQLYVYNEDMICGSSSPHYQSFKQGDGYSIHTCKTKVTRNPLYRWVIGAEGCSINEFAFSPCGQHLAVVSQDGFLRVFNYDNMELVGTARSYFGGFLCVCWSPDGKYVVVGGEDDLVTIWSCDEKRVVARGQGHHSWVSVVAFDPFTTSLGHSEREVGCCPNDEINNECNKLISTSSGCNRLQSSICYRLGSVGQDTQLCLWDITEDVLRQPICPRTRTNVVGSNSGNGSASENSFPMKHNSIQPNSIYNKDKENLQDCNTHSSPPSFTQRLVGGFGSFGDKKENTATHKRNISKIVGSSNMTHNSADDPMKLIGTSACPRFDECPLLEPLVCKKIAQERLTALVFREDCFVAACQDGYVYTWARPNKVTSNNLISSCMDKDL